MSSSTARELANMDIPGLETVHCWSSVRSRVDCNIQDKFFRVTNFYAGLGVNEEKLPLQVK